MSGRDLQALGDERKRQRLEQMNEIQKASLEKVQLQLQIQLQLELSRKAKCTLETTAEAVLCQIFSLLNAREHWNLSTSSHKMKNISRLPSASLRHIEVSLGTDYRVEEYLMQFQPQKLTLPFNAWVGASDETGVFKLNRLRELTFTNNGAFFSDQPCRNIEWTSQLVGLTSLTKLKISDGYFEALPHLPGSLTYLHLPGSQVEMFYSISSNILSRLFNSGSLSLLQVLKLPRNRYYPNTILSDVGKVCPVLRELGLGYFMRNYDLSPLKSCAAIESLTIGVDANEAVPMWETLAPLTLLRNLTVIIYNRSIIYGTLFAGLNKVNQLTSLKLVPHVSDYTIDLNLPLRGLTESVQSEQLTVDEKGNGSIGSIGSTLENRTSLQLTTLLIDENFRFQDARCLSAFPTLTELRLPTSTIVFPEVRQLPQLRTLHTIGGSALKRYQDQVSTVVCRYFSTAHDTAQILPILSKMRQLTTLKLHPKFTLPVSGSFSKSTTTNLFREFLPPTARIEIDTSMEIESYNLS